jgi:serine phosphatase RsbU (regulator of sigma subunit)/PAS domain-containing protein
MLTVLTASALVAAVVLAGMAVHVWRVRGSIAGLALAVLLLAVAWWGAAYAGELTSQGLGAREVWGDLKYVGICLLPPSLLVFVLDYTGRRRFITRRLLVALAVVPVAVWVLLAVPATHDLVRYYVPTPPDQPPLIGSGQAFWANLAYTNLLLVVATVLVMSATARLAHAYRIRAILLVGAALLPWLANLLFNFGVGVFTRLDLTPFAFIVFGGVLVWGLFRPRMASLSSIAWHRVVQTMADGILLLDPFGRVVDANPAAARLFGTRVLRGRHVEELLPGRPDDRAGWEVELATDSGVCHLRVESQQLSDASGAPEGALVSVRDVTESRVHQRQLEELLAERTRIAATLTSSLLPAQLPSIRSVELASRYLPARGGGRVGGDFFDVFLLDATRWGFVLGDISGKGAEAAAVTGLVRYTLRAYATPDAAPSAVLAQVNQALLRSTDEERYCTVVYGVAEPSEAGLQLRLCLGGHHQPVLRRVDGQVSAVGETGTALGLLAEPPLGDTSVLLEPGDLLCLFTDGLVEARARDDWFGVDRVLGVLHGIRDGHPERAVTALVEAVDDFQAGPRIDDLALLAMRFCPCR